MYQFLVVITVGHWLYHMIKGITVSLFWPLEGDPVYCVADPINNCGSHR